MTIEEATAYTIDARGRLHRPSGQFAGREEISAYGAAVLFAVKFRAAAAILEQVQDAALRASVRRLTASEVRPVKPLEYLTPGQQRHLGQCNRWGFVKGKFNPAT